MLHTAMRARAPGILYGVRAHVVGERGAEGEHAHLLRDTLHHLVRRERRHVRNTRVLWAVRARAQGRRDGGEEEGNSNSVAEQYTDPDVRVLHHSCFKILPFPMIIIIIIIIVI